MALLISHRGNTNGINREKENSIEYIQEALNKEFFCNGRCIFNRR